MAILMAHHPFFTGQQVMFCDLAEHPQKEDHKHLRILQENRLSLLKSSFQKSFDPEKLKWDAGLKTLNEFFRRLVHKLRKIFWQQCKN